MSAVAAPKTDEDDLLARLKAFEGVSVGAPTEAPDPVNQPMIRHWVEAMGDENPVYIDSEVARSNGFPGVVAPPTMLQAWTIRGYRASAQLESERGRSTAPSAERDGTQPGRPEARSSAQDQLFSILDSAGFTSVVATNCEQHYLRPLVPGDRLTASSVIEAVSDRKATALGEGHFVTTRTDFTDQDGATVATMRFRILRFRPARAKAGQADGSSVAGEAPRRPRPAITQDNAFFFEGAREGKLLVQRCSNCGQLRHPPRPACPNCRSFDWESLESSGNGSVYSFVVVHHPQVPGFDYPLPIALVELEEGWRLVADLVGVEPSEVSVGMPVECEFVAVDEDLVLPMFRPRAPQAS